MIFFDKKKLLDSNKDDGYISCCILMLHTACRYASAVCKHCALMGPQSLLNSAWSCPSDCQWQSGSGDHDWSGSYRKARDTGGQLLLYSFEEGSKHMTLYTDLYQV